MICCKSLHIIYFTTADIILKVLACVLQILCFKAVLFVLSTKIYACQFLRRELIIDIKLLQIMFFGQMLLLDPRYIRAYKLWVMFFSRRSLSHYLFTPRTRRIIVRSYIIVVFYLFISTGITKITFG